MDSGSRKTSGTQRIYRVIDKLRGIGFNLDELREMVGYPLLNTDFSQERALTKNYGEEGSTNET